jgi:hypothetical protein
MFFEFKLEYPEDLYNRRITFTMYDVDKWTKNQIIGVFELDLDYIYNMPTKDLFRNWVALYDPTGKFPGVQGYLRMSISILGPGDEQVRGAVCLGLFALLFFFSFRAAGLAVGIDFPLPVT